MPVNLDLTAVEKSSFFVAVAFQDEDENEVAPNEITWTLTDARGTVINDRDQVAVDPPAQSITIVLSGDDLSLAHGVGPWRLLTIEATYDSDAGTDLPLKESARFKIDNLIAVT